MFQKQTLALLACIASTAAFAPVSLSVTTNAQKTFMPKNIVAAASYAALSVSLNSEVEESAEAVVEIPEVAVVAEVAAEAEVVAAAPAAPAGPVEDDINCVAYVVNLSYDTPFFTVKELFAEFGTVGKVFMPKNRDTGRTKGIAFVTMASEEERDAAIAGMNEKELDGRTVYVDKAKPRGAASEKKEEDNTMTKIYIGNISYETTAESITEHFSQYGEVSSVYVPMDRYSGQPRGFAFLAMPNEVAEAAIAASDGMEMDGRNVEVKVSLPRGAKAPSKTSETKLYIGNISFDTQEQTLRELFEDYGPVIDMYIPLDQNTGRPRGFAFVTLEPQNAGRAIEEVDGWEVDGRMLRVNEAQAKGSGGGGGGYSSGGGGGYSSNQSTNEW